MINIIIHMSIIIRFNYRKQYKIFKMILFKINLIQLIKLIQLYISYIFYIKINFYI